MKLTLSRPALMGAALAVSVSLPGAPQDELRDLAIRLSGEGVMSSAPACLPQAIESTSTASASVNVPVSPSSWTSRLERRFRKLAGLEATGQLSAAESAELEQLARDRRILLCPSSTEEVLSRIRERRLAENLIRALSQYVERLNPQDKARPSAA
jgi:hypothetical protein